jgi:hypothetical protein
MRHSTGAIVCALAFAALSLPAARADAAFTDIVCPEASQYVVAVGQLKPSDPPQRVYDAANAAAVAYDVCAKRQLADANLEPGVHYAYTREAGFAIVSARALIALNRQSDAKAVVQNARRLAQDVVDWRRSIQQNGSVIASSGSNNQPSAYRDAARDVVAAADQLLANLSGVEASSPAPAASAVPAPASTPHR